MVFDLFKGKSQNLIHSLLICCHIGKNRLLRLNLGQIQVGLILSLRSFTFQNVIRQTSASYTIQYPPQNMIGILVLCKFVEIV